MKIKILTLLSIFFCAFNTMTCMAEELMTEETSAVISSNMIDINIQNTGNISTFELPRPEPYSPEEHALGGKLPSYYNALDENIISPYKDQQDTTLCWTFATCGMIETNLAKKGYPLTPLSPYYLAKATLTPTDYNDTAMKAGYITDNEFYFEPGSFLKATTTLRRGHGLQPLDDYNLIMTNSIPLSNEDLPYTMTGYEIFQGCKNFDSYDDFATTLDLIKEKIINYGSAYLSFNMNYEAFPAYEDGHYYLSYTDKKQDATHAVQVIGYDDNFNKDLFVTNKPKHDGAFICKQSFGIDKIYAPIVYIPYEDMSIDEIDFIDMEMTSSSKNKFDYLGAMYTSLKIYANNKPCNFFNVFENNTDNIIYLTNVSADFLMYDYHGTVQIYKNPAFRANAKFTKITDKPCYICASGIPVFKEPIYFNNYSCGMTQINLPKTIKINPGESYQIVFTIFDKDEPKIANTETCYTDDKYTGAIDDFLTDKLYGDVYVDGNYISDEKIETYGTDALTKNDLSYPIFNNIGIQSYYTIGEHTSNEQTIKCNFNGKQYTILLDTEESIPDLPNEIKTGYKLPKPKKTGYKFKYWTFDGKNINKITKKLLKSSYTDTLILKPHYIPKKYKMTYLAVPPNADTPVIGSPKSQTATYDKEFYFKGKLKAKGYTLIGWRTGDNNYPLNDPAKNLTDKKCIYLAPIWKKNE